MQVDWRSLFKQYPDNNAFLIKFCQILNFNINAFLPSIVVKKSNFSQFCSLELQQLILIKIPFLI